MMRTNREGLTMGASKPRKQHLMMSSKALAEPAYAVVRVCWYQAGKAHSVDELQLEDGIANIDAVLETVIANALRAGADVSVITTGDVEQLKVDP